MIDGEWLQLAERVSYTPADDIEIGGYVPFLARTGGETDASIEHFHNAMGIGNQRREGYPRNQCIVDFDNREGQHTHWEGDQFGLSDVSLFTAWTITHGGRYFPGISAGIIANLPTGDEDQFLASGSPVYGMTLLMAKRISTLPWLLFLGGSASYTDNDEMAGLDTRKTQYTGLGGIEYEWSDRLSFIAQNLTTSPIAKDCYELSKPTNELNVGIRFRDGCHGMWEFCFQENLFYFNNSSDVGLHLGYRCTL